VEVVRQLFEAGSGLGGRLLQGTDLSEHPFFSLWHSECMVEEVAEFPDTATYSGRAGVARYFQQMGEAFDAVTYTPQEIIDGMDGVLAVTDVSGRSKAGVDVQTHIFQVFRLQEGAVIYATAYLDRHQALKAVGLEGQAVSEENVEIVRRWIEFWSTSPEQTRPGVARFFDADADYYPVPKFPEARPCHGQDEIVQFFVGFMGAWSRYEYAIRQLVEAGDDRVLVCGRVHAEGQESGLILDGDLYYCMWLRHGRFFRAEDHLTMKGALHALGFEGETLEEAGLKGAEVAD
jgi:ketosteroid isomerase-like protein